MSDVIVVRIPASTAHVALVRAAASALAARLDFTYDRITDLHIAIDEVCSRILATSEPAPGRLEVTFDVSGDGLRVAARGDTPPKPGTQFLNRWSEMILESVTDELEVSEANGTSTARFAVGRGEGR
jgi:serine/threonine-protein kinase RsbW